MEEPALQAPSSAALSTTVVGGGPNKITNTSTERFGIYAMKSGSIYKTFANCQYKIDWTSSNTGNLTPTTESVIVYPSDGSQIDFYAYYPYTDDIGGTSTDPLFSVKNWNVQSTPDAIDLLVAEKASGFMAKPAENTQPVNLNFYHKFSKIILNITADSQHSLLQTSDLQGMVVKASNMNVKASCNVFTGAINLGETVDEEITFSTKTNGEVGQTSEAIICPGYNPKDSNSTPLERLITITLPQKNNIVYQWAIPSNIVFASGNSYIWNLQLVGDELIKAELIGIFHDWETVNHEHDIILGNNSQNN